MKHLIKFDSKMSWVNPMHIVQIYQENGWKVSLVNGQTVDITDNEYYNLLERMMERHPRFERDDDDFRRRPDRRHDED